MKHLIRPARLDDAVSLQRFVSALFSEKLGVIYKREAVPSVHDEKQFIRRLGESDNSCLLLAFDENELIGMLDLLAFSEPQRSHCANFGLSVAKRYRGQGVGRALLETMIQFAKDTNHLKRIELEVFDNNTSAIRLYKNVGFLIEGRKCGAVKVEGGFVDIFNMVLTLD